ncbi:SPASM domain-containing protein [bacterium]|nr:SPASM domain-containing protein [bacterium]
MGSHSRTARHGRLGGQDAAFFAAHRHTRVPQLVQWLTTLRCPMSCPHCLAAGESTRELDLHEAANLIEQVAEMGVDEFLLTGGEPLAREDLADVVGLLREHGVRWSLNTAAMPGPRLRRAMEAWPPSFVAVSLDGPPDVHDRFRGRAGAFDDAIASLAYFADLAEDGVAAGTTVTQANYGSLPETFSIVLESAATSWGLHLIVPEGRAAERPDLLLSRAQLKRLLRFAAAKRHYLPVSLADEIGYCGFWEPLVRGEPFFCGAGRAQCVVLPDGEVTPCTTLDRSTSAGNVTETPLREIWETGFAELRAGGPEGRCARCRFAPACEGGCWLQRRHGTQCFRDVWRMPRAVTSVGAAVMLGLALPETGVEAAEPPVVRSEVDAAKMQVLQRSIIQWYAADLGSGRSPSVERVKASLKAALPEDAGGKYFLSLAEGDRPASIVERARRIEAALATSQRSLCLLGLAWRDVTEWCLDHTPPAQRTGEERKALRDVVARLSRVAHAWRVQIFEEKLDPFLRRPATYRRFFISKAGPRPHERLAGNVASKRGWRAPRLARELVKQQRFGDVMALPFRVPEGAGVACLRDGEWKSAGGTLRVFDILRVPGDEAVRATFQAPGDEIEVELPAGADLTYGDVLRLAMEQEFTDPVKRRLVGSGLYRPSNRHAFALPLLRERVRTLEVKGETARTSSELRQAKWLLTDLYLF